MILMLMILIDFNFVFFDRPFWLSPRQICIVPIAPAHVDYCRQIQRVLWNAGFFADVDDGPERFQKKIAIAQTAQYNFILLAGDEEVGNGTVNIRTRDNQQHGEKTVQDLIADFNELKATYQ